jgi:hypothetical protein
MSWVPQRVLPFIRQSHQYDNYLFWPDLSTSHYAKDCVDWMKENINFVAKYMNPPNVPQTRPIENLWEI